MRRSWVRIPTLSLPSPPICQTAYLQAIKRCFTYSHLPGDFARLRLAYGSASGIQQGYMKRKSLIIGEPEIGVRSPYVRLERSLGRSRNVMLIPPTQKQAASSERAGFASRLAKGVSNPHSDASHRACSHPAYPKASGFIGEGGIRTRGTGLNSHTTV